MTEQKLRSSGRSLRKILSVTESSNYLHGKKLPALSKDNRTHMILYKRNWGREEMMLNKKIFSLLNFSNLKKAQVESMIGSELSSP